jgi:hypothetical protein
MENDRDASAQFRGATVGIKKLVATILVAASIIIAWQKKLLMNNPRECTMAAILFFIF